ncbi:hypothetical protein F751_1264 [Auxenochlorella protothecoides]|uniref:Uncharacterized protein n=1 Tax=Auxenochlorella protothecoides TaxID=3075 RepID=A0A087SMY7_AUXPR|nr:hypothetical protein F751_1264 [Auxenochlorella protothecoides]KFM27091.1 hypothetical protein F751_1264 [Auxenochlorella protothecoides]
MVASSNPTPLRFPTDHHHRNDMATNLCATTMVVRLAMRRSSASCTTASLSASRAEVASSRSSTLGSLITARAMAMRCFCPPLSWMPPSPTRVW